MRYLLLSDIHANLEALEAVLQDAEGQYESILCCGDLVGYGPDPNAVIEWARENVGPVIRGNHDRACCGLESLEWFNPTAQQSSRWTMAHLKPDNLAWLRTLARGPCGVEDFRLAHGSPLDEDEYLSTPEDAANVFDYLDTDVTFFGHTHLQGGFVKSGGWSRAIARPAADQSELTLRLEPGDTWLVNPGSVGQPRDQDPRAAYALLDSASGTVVFRRVRYDFSAVARKIKAAGLPASLGQRLSVGR